MLKKDIREENSQQVLLDKFKEILNFIKDEC